VGALFGFADAAKEMFAARPVTPSRWAAIISAFGLVVSSVLVRHWAGPGRAGRDQARGHADGAREATRHSLEAPPRARQARAAEPGPAPCGHAARRWEADGPWVTVLIAP
jgi:hypothetical protein